MFNTRKRPGREKHEFVGTDTWLTEAILKNSDQGLFLMDAAGKLLPPVSRALSTLFRRMDFPNLAVEKLLSPVVSADTLARVETHLTHLFNGTWNDGKPLNVLEEIEVHLMNDDGSVDIKHYQFDFDAVDMSHAPTMWLVRVTDVTAQVSMMRELEELRSKVRTQGAILRGTLQTDSELENALRTLTETLAAQQNKQVHLDSTGLHLVPPRYQTVVKTVASQLIRNAVIHGIETPSRREAAGKSLHGTLRLEFSAQAECFELAFEDDGQGLHPAQVRATAVQRGMITAEAAASLLDRDVIKLIFKSRFTTLADSATDTTHGTGMSLVRRYVHGAGGKIALASLPGHETRFKITLPAQPAAGTGTGERAANQPQVA